MISIRAARLPEDAVGIAAIERTVEAVDVLIAKVGEQRIDLTAVARQVNKAFPLDDLDDPGRPWDRAWVAETGERIVGFAATGYQAWNRRLVLWHLYVDSATRRRGVGRQLCRAVLQEAASRGARHVWLETSNENIPGIAAYERLGFRLCGLDVTLYDGTPAEGEFALFFSRPVDAR